MERKTTSSQLRTLGKQKLLLNDVLVLDFNIKGILVEKNLLTLEDMNDLTIVENSTTVLNRKSTFVYSFLSSLRQKINDPLGKKSAK